MKALLESALSAACLLAAALPSRAQQTSLPPTKPLRFEEDYSTLSEEARKDPWLRFKHVPLSDDGRVWASFGGQIRERVEVWRSFNFGRPPAAEHDDEFGLQRVFVHGDFHFGESARLFVEAKSALATDRDLIGQRRTIDVDELDLQNAFADWKLRPGAGDVTLRAGRQELLFGKQRLVSPLEWVNTRRTFEGFASVFDQASWRASAFVTRPVIVDKYDFNEGDEDTDFYGLYVARKPPQDGLAQDFYWLALERDAASFNGTSGAEQRHTLGARLGKTPAEGLDFDAEAAFQFGEVGSADIAASMLGAQVGWRSSATSPRLYLGLDYGSGDEDAGDGDVETFNQLFPLGHEYLGAIDAIGRQNIVALSAGCFAKPRPGWSADVRGHVFRLADEDDGLYNAAGALSFGPGGSSKDVGEELDLVVTWTKNSRIMVQTGYGHFFTGDHLDEIGADEDVDFAYVTLQVTY